ncbi:hypothetical protein KM043_013190 [Ampulex compressa]|nr:hypothetical protein KM043_013190 [Ampulex compressa]
MSGEHLCQSVGELFPGPDESFFETGQDSRDSALSRVGGFEEAPLPLQFIALPGLTLSGSREVCPRGSDGHPPLDPASPVLVVPTDHHRDHIGALYRTTDRNHPRMQTTAPLYSSTPRFGRRRHSQVAIRSSRGTRRSKWAAKRHWQSKVSRRYFIQEPTSTEVSPTWSWDPDGSPWQSGL